MNLYHIRFALHLWWNVRDMSLLQAWGYPHDDRTFGSDPVANAEAEMSEMLP
jgi:hypothetical protein